MKALLVLSSILALSVALRFDRDQVLTIHPKTQAHVNILKELEDAEGVDFWSPPSASGVRVGQKVDIRFTKSKLSSIKSKFLGKKLDFEVKIKDVQESILRQFDMKRSRKHVESYLDYNYNVYHTYDEIDQWITDTANAYPTLARKSLLTISTEGREVNMLTLGSSTDKPIFLIDCGVHAREWISPAFCQCFIRKLLEEYGTNVEVTRMMDELTWQIIPVLNVDGYEYSWTSNRMWRKTRSNYGTGCTGVDANRNFDINWSGEGASSNPCSETYYGPSVESEPIVKAISDIIRNNRPNIKGYIAFHSYTQVFVYPYSYDYVNTTNAEQLYDLSSRAADVIFKTTGKVYTYGPGHQSMYLVSGGSKDMALNNGIPLSFTIELRDTGEYGFLLPESEIEGTCLEMNKAMVLIADEAIATT